MSSRRYNWLGRSFDGWAFNAGRGCDPDGNCRAVIGMGMHPSIKPRPARWARRRASGRDRDGDAPQHKAEEGRGERRQQEERGQDVPAQGRKDVRSGRVPAARHGGGDLRRRGGGRPPAALPVQEGSPPGRGPAPCLRSRGTPARPAASGAPSGTAGCPPWPKRRRAAPCPRGASSRKSPAGGVYATTPPRMHSPSPDQSCLAT